MPFVHRVLNCFISFLKIPFSSLSLFVLSSFTPEKYLSPSSLSGGWQLQGHNQVELAVMGLNFFFFFFFFNLIWFCLGLRCESCDVGCLELFRFKEDEWIVIGGAIVDGSCWITRCSPLWV